MAKANESGIIIGYDPGGNGAHGYAEMEVEDGAVTAVATTTLASAEAVLSKIEISERLLALGVDTLTCWGSGPSGWRPADRWLRQQYAEVRNSVISPNGLYGSMGLNGMAVLVSLRNMYPSLYVTETHPKVLYRALSGRRYDFASDEGAMLSGLGQWLGVPVKAQTEHEWDAAISALAAVRGMFKVWRTDLHQLPTRSNERLVTPCGPTEFVWPG